MKNMKREKDVWEALEEFLKTSQWKLSTEVEMKRKLPTQAAKLLRPEIILLHKPLKATKPERRKFSPTFNFG